MNYRESDEAFYREKYFRAKTQVDALAIQTSLWKSYAFMVTLLALFLLFQELPL